MKKLFFFAVFLFIYMNTIAQQRRNPVLDSLRNEKDPALKQHRLKKLENGTEEEMNLAVQFYSSNRSKADSLQRVLLQRYPQGRAAAVAARTSLFNESAEKQVELLAKYKKDFPAEDLNPIYYSIAYAYSERKDTKKAVEYAEQIKQPDYKAIIVESLMDYAIPAAEAMVKRDLAKEKTSVTQTTESKASYYKLAGLYARILAQGGKNAEALVFAEEAHNNLTTRDDILDRNYAYLLSVNGKYKEAHPLLERIVVEGKGDEKIKKQLVQTYKKLNPNEDSAAYLESLENQLNAEIKQKTAKMMISEQSPNFTVRDANGKSVSLADFKGKTIVLDFWATWCGPCKKSFPAMQMAVNKYKNDPNVKFLFIHTWERVADPLADAKNYLSANKYNFDLYMDTRNEETRINPAVSAFRVNAIPAKFVIDGDGKIRFRVMGFSGGNDSALLELSAMIENSRI